MKFKIGDRVRLREDSRWNDNTVANPFGIEGVIQGVGLPIEVLWGNGKTNYYEETDLDLVESEKDSLDELAEHHGFVIEDNCLNLPDLWVDHAGDWVTSNIYVKKNRLSVPGLVEISELDRYIVALLFVRRHINEHKI